MDKNTTDENEAPEAAAEAPRAQPKFTLVVILSMLVGILLTLLLIGGIVYYQKSQALHAEFLAASQQLKEKSQALDEMKAQIEALSKQMHLLKEYSIARSSPPGDKKPEAGAVAPKTPESPPPRPVAQAAGSPATALPAMPAKAKKPKPEAQNCELVGKSAEEQAATLQRCVGAMDGGKAKPRSP